MKRGVGQDKSDIYEERKKKRKKLTEICGGEARIYSAGLGRRSFRKTARIGQRVVVVQTIRFIVEFFQCLGILIHIIGIAERGIGRHFD